MTNSAVLSGVMAGENRVLKNTLMLLAATFAFSAVAAGSAIMLGVGAMNPWIMLGVYIALLVGLHFNQNNGLGVLFCFAITGWLGFSVAPLLAAVMAVNPAVILNAFVMTTVMFVGLSAYATISKRDFSFMSGFLAIGLLVAFVAGLAAMFFEITMLSLIVSAAFVVLSGGVILWQVSSIVNGGETNYVMATVTLFVSVFNIFMSLVNLLGYNSD